MYEITKKPYQKWFKKNEPWNISIPELLEYPHESLGFHLGKFLRTNNFELQPKLEDHDVIHVLTGISTNVEEEIGMQFYLMGNGKRSLYLYMVVVSGALFFPFGLPLFLNYYRRGKSAHHFHHLDFSKMLLQPVGLIKETFKIN